MAPFTKNTIPLKGTGIFAKIDIPQGTLVLTFTGRSTSRQTRYTVQVGPSEHINPGARTWKFANHSCDPSCGVKGRSLVALRDISAGEEITFDYAMTEYRMKGFECRCGAERCRNHITGFKDLPPEFQKRYQGFISSHLLQL